jgi:hypothetical protein
MNARMHAKKKTPRQITVRGVGSALRTRLEAEARKRGTSLNRTVVILLEEACGVAGSQPGRRKIYRDVSRLAGRWTKEHADEFDRALKDQRRIEPELWQ